MKALAQMLAFVRGCASAIPPPREWMLEVTNRCNLACPMCGRDKAAFTQRDMEFGFFEQLLEANKPPEALWPYGFGESLMHPAVFEFIRHAKRKGLVVSLSTNGTLLTAGKTREVIESGLDYLVIAVDGATSKTYAKYRVGGNLNRVKANIERLLALKLDRKSRLHITLQMIRMRDNSVEIPAFRRMWTRSGVDCVRIREDLSRDPDISNGSRPPQQRRRPCFFLWRGPLFIQAAGTVIPCPYYHGSEPFGDLKSETVDAVWNSKKLTELRRAHVAGDVSKYPACATCPRYQPHPLLAASSFFVRTRHVRRFLPFAEEVQRRLGWKFFE